MKTNKNEKVNGLNKIEMEKEKRKQNEKPCQKYLRILRKNDNGQKSHAQALRANLDDPQRRTMKINIKSKWGKLLRS